MIKLIKKYEDYLIFHPLMDSKEQMAIFMILAAIGGCTTILGLAMMLIWIIQHIRFV